MKAADTLITFGDKATPSNFFVTERPALPGASGTSRVIEHDEGAE